MSRFETEYIVISALGMRRVCEHLITHRVDCGVILQPYNDRVLVRCLTCGDVIFILPQKEEITDGQK